MTCPDYTPLWKGKYEVKSWICKELGLTDFCECGDSRFFDRPCPWEGRPEREKEHDLIAKAPRRKE